MVLHAGRSAWLMLGCCLEYSLSGFLGSESEITVEGMECACPLLSHLVLCHAEEHQSGRGLQTMPRVT